MRQIITFSIIGILALLILGIDGCQKTETVVNTEGIEMSFVANAPPDSVMVNQEFPIYVDVLNKGSSNLNSGDAKFYLSGIGYDLKNVEKSVSNTRFLSGQSTIPERLVFAKNARWTTPLENSFPLYLILTGCYNYGSASQVDVCVSNKNSTTLCSISGEKIKSNSNNAAPIQVTSVTEKLEGSKLQIIILLENKKIAQVAPSHVYLVDTDCDKILTGNPDEMQKENKVKAIIRTGAEPGWVCKLQSKDVPYAPTTALEGVVTLEPVGKIVCEKNVQSEDTHMMPLTVSLLYRYSDSITKTVRIAP